MALGVLNNISAVYAQNNLANTQASLQKTLQQLSSGSRINSGADDAAGLSLANGLQASATALSQSAKNASQGVDFLQVADGALSQVTNLLNRAVTLATEASNGTLNSSQVGAANSEYQKILNEIDTINNNTEYNGINTFAKNSAYSVANASDKIDIGNAASGIATVTYGTQTLQLQNHGGGGTTTTGVIASGGTGIYKVVNGTDTISTLANQINQQFGASVATVQAGQLVLSGGASISGTSVSITTGGGGSTVTIGNANDTIAPGSAGITYTNHAGAAAVLAGGFGANGAGGTLTQLAAAINAVDVGSATLNAAGTVMTIAAGSGGTLTGVSTARESGSGVPALSDSIDLTATGGTSTLTVGNAADTLTPGAVAIQVKATGSTATSLTGVFAANGTGGNLTQLAADINTQFGSLGVNATISDNKLTLTGGTISQTAANMTELSAANSKTNKTVAIFTSDGTISQSYNNTASDMVQSSASALSLAGTSLTSTSGAQASLVAINSAITTVAASRGTIGANINTLTAVGNVMTTQSTNTLAAQNDVTATDYSSATSEMSKFQILSQTGIAALAQANQAQQLITKLLQ